MKFFTAALIAIVALTETTEAGGHRYKGISRDCRSVKWTIKNYGNSGCIGRAHVTKHFKFPKCMKEGKSGYSAAYECNKKEIKVKMYKGSSCQGRKVNAQKKFGGPRKWEFEYDKCISWGKTSFRISPEAKR